MSTVTLSKPHCAITSAENPDGIASQAFTTALPEAHTFFTLFATLFPSLCPFTPSLRAKRSNPSPQEQIGLLRRYAPRNDGSKSRRRPLYADLADADFAGGVHYRRPGVIRQGHPVFGAIGAHFPLGIAGDQHGVDAGDRPGRPDKVDIARDFAVEELAGVDHLGVDVDRQHAVGKAPVRRGGGRACQRAAEQFADEGEARTLV